MSRPSEFFYMAEERLQRRLAAILSADVVGYSRLMGVDEAGTLSRLNALRRELIDPAIAAHSGRIVKLMGDGAARRGGNFRRTHASRHRVVR
jgi:class 3 adenylate cyclase